MKRSRFQKSIIECLSYFSRFSYAPTLKEAYTFIPYRLSYKAFLIEIKKMITADVLIAHNGHIAMIQHSSYFADIKQKKQLTRLKLEIATSFLYIATRLPAVSFIGLSGSLSMNNAQESDDIDLFVISATRRMWTARLQLLLLAMIMGIRRKRSGKDFKNKICLNLFFDKSDMTVPIDKQTYYVAHEVLQMKPFSIKSSRWEQTYQQFMYANEWVYTFFPNARVTGVSSYANGTHADKDQTYSFLLRVPGHFCERISRLLQLTLINKHKTIERISDTQLWFFPTDVELCLGK